LYPFVRHDLVRFTAREQSSKVKNGNLLSETDDHRHVVFNHQNGPALGVQSPNERRQHWYVFSVDAGHGLIKQEDARLGGQEDR
jgi:hypothetical protein